MGLSKSNRILILLAIDSLFFLLEIVVGYAVHSLALVADSFHMLNDVISLVVGLWAVRVANSSANTKMYTYGWQRAETLGALINGVFLVALCLSIFLEAIQRFVEPQEVSNPKLVLIVGCCGLASNLLGLVLFHDHGHAHGGEEEEHGHSHGDPISTAEEGHSHVNVDQAETQAVASESGNVADILPQSAIGAWQKAPHEAEREFSRSDEDDTTASSGVTPTRSHGTGTPHARHRRRTSGSMSRSRGFGSVDNLHIHPASFRNDIIQASRLEALNSESDDEEDAIVDEDDEVQAPHERSELLKHPNGSATPKKRGRSKSHASHKQKDHRHDSWHADHTHAKPAGHGSGGGHGHSHGDLNMKGVFLHVMGDALGNIGVIVSALFIWLTSFSWRYYFDPAVSLIITCIILASAIPLCKAASRILLQAVPTGMSIDDIRDDIEGLPGVIGCHHLHVWQLSGTKHVASLHIQVDCEIRGVGSDSYMHLAGEVRRCLHEYGIHSSTIQPEFTTREGSSPTDVDDMFSNGHGGQTNTRTGENLSRSNSDTESPRADLGSKTGSVRSEPRDCLLECGDECGGRNRGCCPPQPKKKT